MRRCLRFSLSRTKAIISDRHRLLAHNILTLQKISCSRRNLHTHNSRRVRVQPDPSFIQHPEPLGILGHRLGIGRRQEELDPVIGVGLESRERSLDDSDGVLDNGREERRMRRCSRSVKAKLISKTHLFARSPDTDYILLLPGNRILGLEGVTDPGRCH